MSRTASLAVATLLLGTGAGFAQTRASTVQMPCARAAAIVRAQGAVVLGTGGATYDRFVSDRRFCGSTETTKIAFVPAADTAHCAVGFTCFERFQELPGGAHF